VDISSTIEFAAEPARVYAMMTDPDFLEQVCEASEASAYDVSVTGVKTKTHRTLKSPAAAARFTGPDLPVVEEVSWGPDQGDGSRSGELKLSIPGQPVTMNGSLALGPGGPGTRVQLTGQLKVNIPFVGKKMEEAAAPAVLAGFRVQQKVGDSWLAG
jgi:hypothetical protein